MHRLLLSSLLLLLTSSGAAAVPVALARTETVTLKSAVNGIEYQLYVGLPRDYETSTERYPVVYTLDADYAFAIARNVVEHLADRDHLRWAIVVSVAYAGPDRYRINRTRDYTPTRTLEGGYGPAYQKHSGGGPKFREFIETELLPFIDGRYRTTKERVLVGHSYGGLFGAWTLLTRPDLFTGYVIVSPSLWYDDQMIFGLKGAPKARAYIAAGSLENSVMAETARRFASRLPSPHKLEILDDETHNSIFPSAFSRGIRWVMKGR